MPLIFVTGRWLVEVVRGGEAGLVRDTHGLRSRREPVGAGDRRR
ncbi:hypothetical protein [Planotetraspora sp. GP83]